MENDGKFKKGHKGSKPKGAVNKITKAVKEVFAEVFNELQEDKEANLKVWAQKNTTEFYKLSTKLLPIQITGDAENPVPINITEGLTFAQLYELKYGTKPK